MSTSLSRAWLCRFVAGAALAAASLPASAENNWYVGFEYDRTSLKDAEGKLFTPGQPATGMFCLPLVGVDPLGGTCAATQGTFDDFETTFEDGNGFAFSLGYDFAGPARVDVSLKRMKNDVDEVANFSVDGDITSNSLLTSLWFDFNRDGTVQPYVGLGIGASEVEFSDDEDTVLIGQAGLGLNFVLSDALTLDLGARYFEAKNPEYENFSTEYNGTSIALGLRFNFPGDDGSSGDADGDGVINSKDRCPGTPRGEPVNEFGCSDSDGDGVADNLDRCPDTPPGTPVNESGCADLDGDGVIDTRDLCPGTPAGTVVDANGCSDSDGDGISDRVDACPDSEAGRPVMSNGCGMEQSVTLEGVNFGFNSSKLEPNARRILDLVAKSLKESPGFVVEIQGHTDNKGSDAYNLILSQDRANEVKAYLVSLGVAPDSVIARGYGERQPIADNGSAEGRELNRRVEMKVIKEG